MLTEPNNIIFCADGTWNSPGETDGGHRAPSNVRKFYDALPGSDSNNTKISEGQIAFYEEGIGTSGNFLDRVWDGATSGGLFEKIKHGYKHIARSYNPGDHISLIGFSRGAYIARSLAGMIANCGLPDRTLPEAQFNQAVEAAFAAYRNPKERAALLASMQTKYHMRPGNVHFVGVWDTVGSLGIPGGLFRELNKREYEFLDTKLHPNVKFAYHALAADEERRNFPPTLWDNPPAPGQTMEQVWFPGVHSDIGGGYAESDLSNGPLAWMMRKAHTSGSIHFTPDKYAKYTAVDLRSVTGPLHNSMTFLWRLLGGRKQRSIPDGAHIADSLSGRTQKIDGYSPDHIELVKDPTIVKVHEQNAQTPPWLLRVSVSPTAGILPPASGKGRA